MHIVTAREAAALVPDGSTVVPGGFGCCGNPEAILSAIGRRYRETGHPRGLTLFFAAGPGDRGERGLNHLAQDGLVSCAIGGFWGFAPKLGRMAQEEAIEAHNWPQGVMSHLFRATAAGLPGILSRVGIDTFVDPDQAGGRMNARARPGLVQKFPVAGRQHLFFPTRKVEVAIIRGSRCDRAGNIAMDREVSFQDGLAQAQAAHNSGGIVIAQVAEIVDDPIPRTAFRSRDASSTTSSLPSRRIIGRPGQRPTMRPTSNPESRRPSTTSRPRRPRGASSPAAPRANSPVIRGRSSIWGSGFPPRSGAPPPNSASPTSR